MNKQASQDPCQGDDEVKLLARHIGRSSVSCAAEGDDLVGLAGVLVTALEPPERPPAELATRKCWHGGRVVTHYVKTQRAPVVGFQQQRTPTTSAAVVVARRPHGETPADPGTARSVPGGRDVLSTGTVAS